MSAESGAHEQVAHFDVSRHRNIFEFEPIDAPGAGGDAAEVVAIHLHRHRVRRVDHEHHATREFRDFDDLAEQTFGIDHRLADEYARIGAFVDLDLKRVGARHDADQLRDEHLGAEPLATAEQLAQPRVFFPQRDELLGNLRQFQIAPCQPGVLAHQRITRRQRLGRLATHPIRALGDHIDGAHERRKRGARRLQQSRVDVDREQQAGHDRQCRQQIAGTRITQE